MTVSPVRLNHAVLFVAELDRAVQFYLGVFGMELVSHEAPMNATFLRLPRSGNHHDLGLFGVPGAIPQPRRSVGLYHLAWQLDTIDELVEFRAALLAAGAYTGESSHGATKSVYGTDPDGNQFEVMWMLPRAQWGQYGNTAVVERLDLTTEFNTWSGARTAGDLTYDTTSKET
jgi:catechol-2,3-dioxygenase